jgi:hypothetical protein
VTRDIAKQPDFQTISVYGQTLASLKFDQEVHHIVLKDCIAAIEVATARRDRLEADIKAALPEWSLAPVVEALQALRGVGLVAAAALMAELGDITRFSNPRQLMAYLGLVPSEHSSGRTRFEYLPVPVTGGYAMLDPDVHMEIRLHAIIVKQRIVNVEQRPCRASSFCLPG